MPTIKLNKTVFEKLVGKKLSLDQLKDRISMLGTDLESIENNEITVEIFPNRPDMLSEQGFARAFSSFIGVKTGLKKYKVNKSNHKIIVDKNVTMRPYTACAIIKNITFNDEKIREIMQIQEKLATTHGRNRKKSAYGLYPLKNINFPIKYTAKDPSTIKFKPLGFNYEIKASEVEELHPKGREYKSIAENWKQYPFFIDNKNNIMCMLPYTNSQDTGKIDETTKEVFIECTGVNLQNVEQALNIIVTMLADMGGEIYSVEVQYPDKKITFPDLEPKKTKISINQVNKMLGLTLKEKDLKKLLEQMGCGYEKNQVLIPAYRADILHEVDLIEDIAIAYGYENFKEEIPNVATIGKENSLEIFKNKIAEILIGLEMLETFTYNITNKDYQTKKMNSSNKIIELANSVSTENNSLRASILPCLLQVLSENKHREYPQKLFDIGHVFEQNPQTETNIEENQKLSIVLTEEKTNYTKIRQTTDLLFELLGLQYQIKETTHESFIQGRAGEIIINNKKIGILGELHPKVLENWQLENPVAACEINITELFKEFL